MHICSALEYGALGMPPSFPIADSAMLTSIFFSLLSPSIEVSALHGRDLPDRLLVCRARRAVDVPARYPGHVQRQIVQFSV